MKFSPMLDICRFTFNPTCYGVVKPPDAKYHPELRVIWPTDGTIRQRPSYLGGVSPWKHVVKGTKPDVSEGSAIWNFFMALAFRLGYTTYMLELERAERESGIGPMPALSLQESVWKWEEECAALEGDGKMPNLLALVKRIETSAGKPTDRITEQQALLLVRGKIIDEVSANETMLAPSREYHYLNAADEPCVALVRDHSWDWAMESVRGKRCKQFWSLNRWPLDLGHLTDGDNAAVKTDADLDPAQTYDPTDLDPTAEAWKRPKLKKFNEKTNVKFRPGRPVFPVGDTKRQRRLIEGHLTEVGRRGKSGFFF